MIRRGVVATDQLTRVPGLRGALDAAGAPGEGVCRLGCIEDRLAALVGADCGVVRSVGKCRDVRDFYDGVRRADGVREGGLRRERNTVIHGFHGLHLRQTVLSPRDCMKPWTIRSILI